MNLGFFALLAFSAPAFATDEISLLSTVNVPMSRYGMTWQNAQLRIRVQNLAYEKSIRVVLTDAEGKVSTTAASYLSSAADNTEVWEAFTNVSGSGIGRFHLEYTVHGETFTTAEQELKNGPILHNEQNIQQILTGKAFYNGYANFNVAVRNLAWHKSVQVHYSCDDFASETVADLRFQPYFTYGYGTILSPTPEGFEIWSSGSIPVPATCSTLRSYFTYAVDGQHYADTNFGSNYAMFRN